MKLCAIETKELEDKVLTRFAENQNDELLEDLSDYVINSQKEIERLKDTIDNDNNVIKNQDLEIERLEKRNKEIYEGFMATTEELCEATKEIERLNSIINRIKSIYSSLCFSAPENNYIFIEKLGKVLQELKGSDKAIPPDIIGTNGEDGELFDYGDR